MTTSRRRHPRLLGHPRPLAEIETVTVTGKIAKRKQKKPLPSDPAPPVTGHLHTTHNTAHANTHAKVVNTTPHRAITRYCIDKPPFLGFFWMRLYRALRGCSCRFLEDRMMDIITGRALPLARAESHLSQGSQELAVGMSATRHNTKSE